MKLVYFNKELWSTKRESVAGVYDCVGFLMHLTSNQSEKPMMCQDPSPSASNFPLVENDPPPPHISAHIREKLSLYVTNTVQKDHYLINIL